MSEAATTDRLVHLQHREAIYELCRRAEALPDHERELFADRWHRRLPITTIASNRHMPEDLVRRSLQRIERRLRSRLFGFWFIYRAKLPPDAARVADLAIRQGVPLRATATLAGMSLHDVRRHLTTIKELLRWSRHEQSSAS